MTSRWVIAILCAYMGCAHLVALPIIDSVEAEFDIAPSSSLEKSIRNYLQRFLNLPASPENQQAAENFLKTMYFISQARCRIETNQQKNELFCSILSKRIINQIVIKGLPVALLEGEIKRKLPIQVGVVVDYDDSFQDLLRLTKSRIETFLKKSGYYGAAIKIDIANAPRSLNLAVKINISDGVFVRVNDVVVSGNVPIRKRAIVNMYKRMCLTPGKIIDTLSSEPYSCFSHELERENTQSLQEKLAQMGFVQARIRITHNWIDAKNNDAPTSCRQGNSPSDISRCVNLRVDIDKGPHVSWSIAIKDSLAVKRNSFLRFLSSIFSVDLLSRASVPNNSDEIALDHVIVVDEVFNQVTFAAGRNIDEQEIAQSKKAIIEYLNAQGYPHAEVISSFSENDGANIAVNFDIYLGRPQYINSVRIMPQKFSDYISDDILYSRLKKRSITNSGSFSVKDVEDTKDQITQRLTLLGFSPVNVIDDLVASQTGQVDAVFYVKAGERVLVHEIEIINGVETINEKAIIAFYNCDKFFLHARHEAGKNICHGSSFVKDKIDDDLNRLVDVYKTHGYLYAAAHYSLIEEHNTVKIVFTMFDSRFSPDEKIPLKKQEIKDIFISGNISTNENVIRRLFPKDRKNKTLDPIGLKKGLENMRESGRFSRIDERKIMAGEENSDDVYFLLHVTERPSLLFDTGISFSTDQFFMAEAEVEESNFLSSMLKLNTSLGLGLFWGRQTVFSNKLIWPTMYGKPLQSTLTAPTIVYDDHLHRPNPRRRLRSEVSFALDWRLNNLVKPYAKYRLFLKQVQNFTKESVPHPSFQERLKTLDGLVPTLQSSSSIRGVFEPGISFSDLDNQFNPHKGLEISWWTELSGGPFVGAPPFLNVGWQNRFFIPLGPLTLAFQTVFMRSFIEPSLENWLELKDASKMDSLGGDRTVRGYDDGDIGIYDINGPKSEFAGYFSNIANFEIRFPLSGKGAFSNFSGALFVDQGMLVPCASLFSCAQSAVRGKLKSFGLSLGPAVRYALPVGPISLDYGISPLTGESRVHILFGYAF